MLSISATKLKLIKSCKKNDPMLCFWVKQRAKKINNFILKGMSFSFGQHFVFYFIFMCEVYQTVRFVITINGKF